MGIIEIIALIFLAIFCIAGLVLIFLGIPGTWIILTAVFVYDLLPKLQDISTNILLLFLGMCILGEIIEYYLSVSSTKKYGSSNWGVAGAIIGGIIGAVIGVPVLIIGSVLGLFIGAFFGAFIFEVIAKKDLEKGFRAGVGAFKGKIGAILAKEIIGLGIVVISFSVILL